MVWLFSLKTASFSQHVISHRASKSNYGALLRVRLRFSRAKDEAYVSVLAYSVSHGLDDLGFAQCLLLDKAWFGTNSLGHSTTAQPALQFCSCSGQCSLSAVPFT